MSREHAEHNEQLCELLSVNGGYNDWVVTTAFYAAIHFIEDHLFPLTTESGKTFHNLTHAHQQLRMESPHATRKHLVDKYLPKLTSDYGFLDSASRNARYLNYKLSVGKANEAKSRLMSIKVTCC